jgi:hypothetical protein
MKYYKIYLQLVEKAQKRANLLGYYEKHHIIPKCLGGNNSKENLVKLTAKEHYVAHHLLLKIYPNNNSLYHAFWMMSNRFKISSRDYEIARKIISNNMRKNVGTKEAIRKMRLSKKGNKSWLGKTHTKESRNKQSISAKNRNISPEMEQQRRDKISKSHKGKIITKEHAKNISKSKLGSKNPMYGKIGKNNLKSKAIIQFDKNNNFIRYWDSATIASTKLGLSYCGILNNCNNKTSSSGGFIWKFKNNNYVNSNK